MKKLKNHLPKIIVIVGQTSSGKSEFAVKLAKKMNGEIVSADSRQVYLGMDIGSGKVEGKNIKGKGYFYKNIKHYGIDIASPKKQYSAGKFKKYAQDCIKKILSEGKTPILCGGTGHWVDSVVYNLSLPEVKPNSKIRRQLEKLPTEELFKKLTKLDKTRAKTIDKHNRRRLVRALEIIELTGKKIPALSSSSSYDAYWLGIMPEKEQLKRNIEKRLKERLEQGMLKEVKKLKNQGISWKKLEGFGLEYKFCALYLQKKLTYDEMYSQLLTAIIQFSKRQKTWWKRNSKIQWVTNTNKLPKLF